MGERLRVSVLVPAYRAAGTIGATLEAVLGQTRRADEVLVCDDGSGDGTAEIAERAGVRVLRRGRNGGVSAARNDLLDAAKGDAILFCDADDIPRPRWIETLAGGLEEGGAEISLAGLATGAGMDEIRYVHPVGRECEISGREFLGAQLARGAGVYSYLPCAAFRAELLERGRRLRFVRGLKVQEDEVFMLSLAMRCARVRCSPECVYGYVAREGSACAVHFRAGGGSAATRRQYALRDWSKFLASGRPLFALKAANNLLRSLYGVTLVSGSQARRTQE